MAEKATPDEAGCYVDGSWGQYGIAHMIFRAKEFGYDDEEAIALASKHLDSMHGHNEGLSTDEYWLLGDYTNEAEAWLNENAAPEGFYFGWLDGEFFLQSEEWWEEEAW